MISRRKLVTAGAALALLPRAARAEPISYTIRGTREQGCLMVGKGPSGMTVTLDGSRLHTSSDGWFVFGIAYDRTAPIAYELRIPQGSTLQDHIDPVVRHYDIQAINGLPEDTVEPPPDIAARIAREHALIAEARKVVTDGNDFNTPIAWPCAGRLSGVYGSQRILNGKPMAPHLAVDVAAPEGTPIHAAADGIVAITDEFYLEGGFTLLDHGLGVNSCYLHQSERLVKAGDKVRRGQIIGHIGHTGRATGPHTHWGLNWFQMKLDPSRATSTPVPPLG